MPDDPKIERATWSGNSSRGLLPYETMLKLALYPDALKKVMVEIMSDIASRVPHHIGKAVSQRYAVGTLAAIKRRAPGSVTKFSVRGNTTLKVRGNFQDNLWLEFTGAVFSDWPTKANGKKKLPRWRKVRANKRKGINAHYTRPAYIVTREIIRGKWTPILLQGQGIRIFAVPRGKSLVPMAIAPAWEHPLIMGGTSIPQAIVQPETVKLWEPNVFTLIDKRTAHAVSRHLKT